MITIIWRKKMRGENIKCVMTKTVVKSRPATLNLSSSMSRAFTHLNIEDLKIFHNNDVTAGLFSTNLHNFLQWYFLSHYCWGSHNSSCCVNSSCSPAKENTLSICWLSNADDDDDFGSMKYWSKPVLWQHAVKMYMGLGSHFQARVHHHCFYLNNRK